jgi:hypothetical protein
MQYLVAKERGMQFAIAEQRILQLVELMLAFERFGMIVVTFAINCCCCPSL